MIYVLMKNIEYDHSDVIGYVTTEEAADEAVRLNGGWWEEAEPLDVAATRPYWVEQAYIDALGTWYSHTAYSEEFLPSVETRDVVVRESSWESTEGVVWRIRYSGTSRELVGEAFTRELAELTDRPPVLGDGVRGADGDFGDYFGRRMPGGGYRVQYPNAWPEPTHGPFQFAAEAI